MRYIEDAKVENKGLMLKVSLAMPMLITHLEMPDWKHYLSVQFQLEIKMRHLKQGTNSKILDALREGGSIPDRLDALRTHQMQQILFREILSHVKRSYQSDQIPNLNVFWNNYVKCAVYASVVAVRSFLEFFQLYLPENTFQLKLNSREKRGDDIRIDDFTDYTGDKILKAIESLENGDQRATHLAEIYHLANKNTAHVTEVYNEIENRYISLESAVETIEHLLERFVYTEELKKEYGITMPPRFIK